MSRIFSYEINLGHVLQMVTVVGTVSIAIFNAGTWVAQVRGDLHQLQDRVAVETEERKRDVAAIIASNKDEVTELRNATTNEARSRQNADDDLEQVHRQILDALNHLDRSYQRFFSTFQPQPPRRTQR
jgi:hypothetical protein